MLIYQTMSESQLQKSQSALGELQCFKYGCSFKKATNSKYAYITHICNLAAQKITQSQQFMLAVTTIY